MGHIFISLAAALHWAVRRVNEAWVPLYTALHCKITFSDSTRFKAFADTAQTLAAYWIFDVFFSSYTQRFVDGPFFCSIAVAFLGLLHFFSSRWCLANSWFFFPILLVVSVHVICVISPRYSTPEHSTPFFFSLVKSNTFIVLIWTVSHFFSRFFLRFPLVSFFLLVRHRINNENGFFVWSTRFVEMCCITEKCCLPKCSLICQRPSAQIK